MQPLRAQTHTQKVQFCVCVAKNDDLLFCSAILRCFFACSRVLTKNGFRWIYVVRLIYGHGIIHGYRRESDKKKRRELLCYLPLLFEYCAGNTPPPAPDDEKAGETKKKLATDNNRYSTRYPFLLFSARFFFVFRISSLRHSLGCRSNIMYSIIHPNGHGNEATLPSLDELLCGAKRKNPWLAPTFVYQNRRGARVETTRLGAHQFCVSVIYLNKYNEYKHKEIKHTVNIRLFISYYTCT